MVENSKRPLTPAQEAEALAMHELALQVLELTVAARIPASTLLVGGLLVAATMLEDGLKKRAREGTKLYVAGNMAEARAGGLGIILQDEGEGQDG